MCSLSGLPLGFHLPCDQSKQMSQPVCQHRCCCCVLEQDGASDQDCEKTAFTTSYLCSKPFSLQSKLQTRPYNDKTCWDVPSSMILHFSALSHRIESVFDKPPLMRTPFLPSGSLFWGLTYLSVTGAEKSKKKTKTQQLGLNAIWPNESFNCHFYGRKKKKLQINKSNFDILFPSLPCLTL